MGILRIVLRSYFAFILISACALAQDGNSTGMRPQTHDPAANQLNVPVPGPTSFDQVLDKVVEREHFFTAQMHHLHPLVETYIQNLKGDKELGMVPVNDQYFLGRIDLSNGTEDRSFMGQPGFKSRVFAKLTSLYAMRFLPLGFAQMVIVDDNFQRKYYDFTFVRREFLGEVRCLVERACRYRSFHGENLGRRPGLQHCAFQRHI